ncbi:L,D-transpeptidase family protein [Hymenobacter busanensis]|uniref:L,D-transpeptidase family protein n=1 Tax=Hymenobacter busanensis TaxID=2607656 RepID=A0A7L4ZTC2_9BACT|nr:L,D-transpeptidase family protein [Hymenobacter busanensis]KAA9327455.1 L,D-transpeptidase family protein [Hymenobacter busanensis]QHJ06207.1 L,D-transpeptidase family protein [Hymenobacter busanensis]
MKSSVQSVFLSSLLWLVCCLLLVTSACSQEQQDKVQNAAAGILPGKKLGGAQPLIDTVYVQKYMAANPAFKDEIDWGKKFYKEREGRLGWFRNHELLPHAERMLGVINQAGKEGLDPKDYKVIDFGPLLAKLKDAADTTQRNALEKEIDVALSATYFNWADDFYRGTVNPREVKNIDWNVKRNKIKLHKALMTILQERESTYPYYEFEPLHPEYDHLRDALARFRSMQRNGGWVQVPAIKGKGLRPGDSSVIVPALRRRLLGFNADGTPNSAVLTAPAAPAPTKPGQPATAAAPRESHKYDADLVAAVKAFQEQNGLKADGSIGPETLRLLNVPLQQRIDQLILNMERWRWIPKKFEPSYLLVNIPDYKLHVVENNREVMTMRVIVGKTLNATPVFSDRMEYVVLAPYWNVPFSIIDKEMRPGLTRDPVGTLDRLDMEVVKGSGAKATPVDPTSIDWANLTDKTWKYTLRRRPGPENDLGNVKFIFPNSNDVYLHDTPHHELFSQAKRGFSHGCVRVEKPMELAEYLLRNKPGWDATKIQETVAGRQEQYVSLPEKLPVYLVYFTAWVDDAGNVHFRDDIYGHDKALAKEYFST